MGRGLFDMDRPFWRWLGRLSDVIFLSLCWYLCCLPVVTIVPACCALYDAISRSMLMENEKGVYKRFFTTFWRELKQGIPLSIFWLIVFGIAFYGDWIASVNIDMGVLSPIYKIIILMTFGYLQWLPPLQSRYQQSFIKLHVNMVKFALARLPGTALMFLATAVVLIVGFFHPYTYILLTAAPGLIAILHSFVVEKAFRRAFPNDYEDGELVSSEEERNHIRRINQEKQAEKEAAESQY